MFDKDAEEYIKKHTFFDEEYGVQGLDVVSKTIFKDGAEFGYNKAREDSDKMKSQFLELCNLKDMRIEELEKANEWHYVKDGDLPKEGISVLVLLENGQPDISGISTDKRWFCTDYYTGEDKVIAWKEIVLPKEIE